MFLSWISPDNTAVATCMSLRNEYLQAYQTGVDGTQFRTSNERTVRGEMRHRPSVRRCVLSVILHVFSWTVFLESEI